jgi:hypothetical protein
MKSKLKKLPNYQILHVVEKRRGEHGFFLQQIPFSWDRGKIPDGRFVATSQGVYLPKRKRGTEFVVHYTEYRQKVL